MFKEGQRWFSQAEPELGLGIIRSVEERQVEVAFPASECSRRYNSKSAPLKRHVLKAGEIAESAEGESFEITEVQEQNGILFYICSEKVIPETLLKSDISLVKPEERLLAGNFDPDSFYQYRYETHLLNRALDMYEGRGLEGSRINILGHQVSIFMDASSRISPKMALADEVGLGKTIEAGMLAKRAIERGLAKRVLVLAPSALVYQWFFEFYKKFDLLFKTLGAGDEMELSGKVDNDDLIISSPNRLLESEEDLKKVTRSPWDLVIVDEAHRYEKGSKAFEILGELTLGSKSAFYLSATPEALGEENFFEILKLLNPQKYGSYEAYQKREQEFRSGEADALLDAYTYERDIFRNRRANLETKGAVFPKKILREIPLKIDGPSDAKVMKAKADELIKLLQDRPQAKVFAIGKGRKLAIETKNYIQKRLNINIALFHGDQSLLERDRQAAYFLDQEGANLLISAETGSEGRNFEHASELFLLDYPSHPQLLLQRIGRLDRIGQKNEVNVHAPYVMDTPEENLFKLYHKGFDLFEKFPTGLIEFYESNRPEIESALKSRSKEFIEKVAVKYKAFQSDVEKDKNRLLDLRSFRPELVEKAKLTVSAFHQKHSIHSYLQKAFELAGVDWEELSEDCYYARPSDNMLVPAYPGLPSEGMSYTANRELALKREDLRFMNFEHPLIKGTMDLFTQAEIGNASLVNSQGKLAGAPFFEFIFKACSPDLKGEDIGLYFPLTPIRALLSASGEDATKKYPLKFINQVATNADVETADNVAKALPKEAVDTLRKKAELMASQKLKSYKEEAKTKARDVFKAELEKLSSLAPNETVELEARKLKSKLESILGQIDKVHAPLDMVRLVL